MRKLMLENWRKRVVKKPRNSVKTKKSKYHFSDRLKLVFIPFLLIVIGFVAGYSLLNWLLYFKLEIPIKEEIIKIILPLLLSWIPVVFLLGPRINLFQFKSNYASFMLQMLTFLIVVIPTVIAQEFLTSSTGKLTQLENISQFSTHEKTLYYSLEDYFIDKKHRSMYLTSNLSGKYNQDLNFLIFITIPVLENKDDSLKPDHRYWLGKMYSKKIHSRLPQNEKIRESNLFMENSLDEFKETDFEDFSYLEVLPNSENRDQFLRTLKYKTNSSPKEQIIFMPRKGSFEARNGKTLSAFFISLGVGSLVFFIFLLFPKFNETRLRLYKKGKLPDRKYFMDTFDIIIPRKGFMTIPILIGLNTLIFLIMVFVGFGFVSFQADDLLHWGAIYGPSIKEGQIWRLVTGTFLHGGLLHLAGNMFALIYVGFFLEPLLGSKRFVLVYLGTGILASISSIWWHDATIAVGASGAIFGLYGFFLACLITKVYPKDFVKEFLIITIIYIGFNLLLGLIGNIDNAAHIGGLLSGFLIGWIMSRQLKEKIE